jgi:hypothetical protein
MITVLDMNSRATRSLTTSAGMRTHSRNFFCFKTTTKKSLALTVTFIKWGKRVHGGVTQRCTPQLGFKALTLLFMHMSTPILVDSLCSRGMDQRMIVAMPFGVVHAYMDQKLIKGNKIKSCNRRPKHRV